MRRASGLSAAFLCLATPVSAMETRAVTYTCERGVEVPAFYVNDEGEPGVAVILVEGRMVNLVVEPSASGARYGWPSDGSHYVWWTRGDEATLYWSDGETGEEVTLLAECVAG